MTPTLGLDFFSINGIPSDIEAMAKAFPFGKHDDMVDPVLGVYWMLKGHRRVMLA